MHPKRSFEKQCPDPTTLIFFFPSIKKTTKQRSHKHKKGMDIFKGMLTMSKVFLLERAYIYCTKYEIILA